MNNNRMTIKSKANSSFYSDDRVDDGINMLELRMDAEDTFSFGSQSLSCSSSCPSTAGSFSSTSSLYDPYTPPSRNSTPQQPISFDCTLDSEPIMFDFRSPPSSSPSNCFQLEMKSTVAPNMLYHGLPQTPSRCGTMFDSTLPLHMDFATPTQDMDSYNFTDTLGSSPFMLSTPSPPFSSNQGNCDMATMWGQHTDGSPITFSSPMPLTPTPIPLGSSHGNIRRRVALDGPQQSSAMLQQHLQRTPTKSRSSKQRSAPSKQGCGASQRNYRVSKNVDRIPARKYRCDLCSGKSYSRHEHLKRHINEVHVDNPTKWICEFCKPEPKEFGRSDNFRDHLRRHIGKSAGSRTSPAEGAALLLAKMESEMKTKKRRAPKGGDLHGSPITTPIQHKPKNESVGSPLAINCL